MEFEEIRKKVYEEYKQNEFENKFNSVTIFGDLVEFALIFTEVAEGIEALRNNDFPNLRYECADIVIRVMNFCSRKGIPLEHMILTKNAINTLREKYHGKKVI